MRMWNRVEKMCDYTLSDSDLSDTDIYQLSPDEPVNIIEEEDIFENDFEPVLPLKVKWST